MVVANTSQKMPETNIEAQYPWCHVDQDHVGNETIRNTTPGAELIRDLHCSGSGHEIDQYGGRRKLIANTEHTMVCEGSSHTTEGPHDTYHMNSHRNVNMGDFHTEVAQNLTRALGGAHLSVAKQDMHHFSNDGKNMQATGDDYVHYYGDDSDTVAHYRFYSGDQTQSTGGNYYLQVEGEHGTYQPNGNMDIQLDAGKYRLYCGSDVLIESVTKITLKSGASTVEITPSGITVTSPLINFNKA